MIAWTPTPKSLKITQVNGANFTSDVLRRLADTPKEITQQELWDKPIYSTSNIPHIGTPVTTREKLTERQKEEMLDALDSYNKIEKKNRKLVK